jgi:hypothetical protein
MQPEDCFPTRNPGSNEGAGHTLKALGTTLENDIAVPILFAINQLVKRFEITMSPNPMLQHHVVYICIFKFVINRILNYLTV